MRRQTPTEAGSSRNTLTNRNRLLENRSLDAEFTARWSDRQLKD